MKIYDISVEFSDRVPLYPGDPKFEQKEFLNIAGGDHVNVSQITFGTHTGTHIDAPKHFLEDGKGIDEIPVETFVGSAVVVELYRCSCIDIAQLEKLDVNFEGKYVLFKTDNNRKMLNTEFDQNYVFLTNEAADFLVSKGVRGVGIDYLSVESTDGKDDRVHLRLLQNEIIILEGLELSEVPGGEYKIVALPLKIPKGNGSPVRAILIED